jgi:hypothetical protein
MIRFWENESGAITTDWIILTAAIGGLCLGAVTAVRGGVGNLAFDIEQSLSGAQVASLGTLGFVSYTAPTLLMLGAGNHIEYAAEQRELLANATTDAVVEIGKLHAEAVMNATQCAGVRSCAMDIDMVALSLTELQNRQADPTVVQNMTDAYQTARARWG